MLTTMRATTIAAAISLLSLPAVADEGTTDALYEALGLPEMLEIMREEGLAYGEEIGADLFDGRTTPEWDGLVSAIYDLDTMQRTVSAALKEELDGEDVEAMLAFFTGEPGRTIIGLEVSARRALLDEAVEEASNDAAAIAIADDTERYGMVNTFVEINNLIETNVVGALNSNYAFYTGLMDGGALPGSLTEEQVLQDVWSQEPEIRANTSEWVYSFLLLAYQPLSDADLEAYIAFSETEAGQGLNAAMFGAFDGMFEDISRALGLASARFMIGEDI